MEPKPEKPLWQVNHFVGSKTVPSYAVFYDGPVWITELTPGSYGLLETTTRGDLRKDPRILCGTYVVPLSSISSTPGWTYIRKQWYPAGTLFRLVKNREGSLVVHKQATQACDPVEFEAGYASWTRSQTDIFVPKTLPRPWTPLGPLVFYLTLKETRHANNEEKDLGDGNDPLTPRLDLHKYSFALCLSKETLLNQGWI
jgi:hypothetical protein